MVSGGCNENCRYHLKDVSFFSFATQTWNDNLPPMNTGKTILVILIMIKKIFI